MKEPCNINVDLSHGHNLMAGKRPRCER
jgi:hypothetical protein